eukprot:2345382-Rhodomonas_salina.1
MPACGPNTAGKPNAGTAGRNLTVRAFQVPKMATVRSAATVNGARMYSSSRRRSSSGVGRAVWRASVEPVPGPSSRCPVSSRP